MYPRYPEILNEISAIIGPGSCVEVAEFENVSPMAKKGGT